MPSNEKTAPEAVEHNGYEIARFDPFQDYNAFKFIADSRAAKAESDKVSANNNHSQ